MLRIFSDKYIKRYDTSTLRYLFLAGESLDIPTWRWISDALGIRVLDHYWQTESGWPMISYMPGIQCVPIKPGSAGKPVVGYAFIIVNEKGHPVPPDTKGYLVVKQPLPPGTLTTLWEEDDLLKETDLPQFSGEMRYSTGDYAMKDSNGYFVMLGRSDEVLNIAGHRLGTSELEEAISSHPTVAEVSVIGVADAIKG